MRVGIDVGGTNTDAVVMDGNRLVAEHKGLTTSDVTEGIVRSMRAVLEAAAVPLSDIQAVMIGTTQFTNAFVEARGLSSVAIVRLCLPAVRSAPPMIDWPDLTRGGLVAKSFLCHGGNRFDGRAISPIRKDELVRVAEEIGELGLESIALSAVFSPSDPDGELYAAQILREQLPNIPISMSHEIGGIGLLGRENATIINACLRGLAVQAVGAFREAIDGFGIDAPIYLSQNDGTLGTLEFAEQYPVSTFTSGPANSMRGAAFLTGESECAVVDIGGTTADIGILQNGFPRQASVDVRVGGVRTNFRLPDLLSLGIGGGSHVDLGRNISVGPRSVGFELTRKALCFGGEVLTATDLAVAAGRADLGDRSLVSHLDADAVRRALDTIDQRIGEAVDRMSAGPAPLPVVLVGGGSILLGDQLEGAASVVRPDHFGVANAIGAAIAQVGAVVERIVPPDPSSRSEAVNGIIRDVIDEAVASTVAAGAVPDSVHVVDIEETTIAYVPGNPIRIKVRTVGDLTLGDTHALRR